MYEVFYSLRAEPFRLSPDHRFCYEHSGYAKARAYMAYALKRAEGFVMITGRPGTGKTTLIGELVENLTDEDVITANLVCTQLEADDLLRTVAYSFEIGSSNVDKAELLQRITVMLNRWHREGRRALLVVDEAQDLSISAMEELRLLTNIQVGGQPLLQIFLLGQPELRDLILSPELEQVHQRIVAASHLEGLQEDEAEAYVLHRLQVVGWQGDPAIDRRIFPLIHKFSEGIPRRINLICSRLFLLGCVEERHEIGPDDVRIVIQELQAESLAAGSWHSEQEFADSGEPDWVVLPGLHPEAAGDGGEPVQLRAVAGEEFVPKYTNEPAQDEAAKKKGLAPLAPLSPDPEASSGFEPEEVSTELLEASSHGALVDDSLEKQPPLDEDFAEFDPPPEFEWQDDGATHATVAQKSETQTQESADSFRLPVNDAQLLPDNTQQNHGRIESSPAALQESASLPDPYERPAGSPMPARVAGSREPGRAVVPPRRAPSLLIVLAIVLALGISLLFFLKLYVGRDSGWSEIDTPSSAIQELDPAAMEEPQAAEPPLPELGQLPSEKWEADGQLIFMDDEEVVFAPGDGQLAALEAALEYPEAQLDTQSEETTALVPDAPTVQAELSTDGDAAEGQGDSASLEPSPEEAAAGVSYSVSFEFDSIILDAEARTTLVEVAQRMQQQARYNAVLTGFADYKGAQAYNLVLSRQRAEVVMEYLVAAGLSAGRLSVDGRGAQPQPQPQPESGQEDISQQLRVVEIDLVDTESASP
jgi:general secretion pathway protein A